MAAPLLAQREGTVHISPFGKTMFQRLALIGAIAGLASVVVATFNAQYRWFPDGCFVGRPRLWLSGVGASLELSASGNRREGQREEAQEARLESRARFTAGGCWWARRWYWRRCWLR